MPRNWRAHVVRLDFQLGDGFKLTLEALYKTLKGCSTISSQFERLRDLASYDPVHHTVVFDTPHGHSQAC